MRPGPRLSWTFVLASLVSAASAMPAREAGEAGDHDPWAPGTSIEPWPLIAQLQGPAALGDDAAAWESALRHADPVARAAAAFAAGRVKPRGATALLAGLILDRDLLVRDAALWALLQIDGADALAAAARALADRREVTQTRDSPDSTTFRSMFMRRGIPVAVAPVAERRAWLDRVDLALLEPRKPSAGVVDSVAWSIDRSEWDAGERIPIRMAVAAQGPARLSLRTSLVVLDDFDPRPDAREKRPRIPATLRQTDGQPGSDVSIDATGRRTMDLSLSLHDLPPGPYLLEGISAGNPLLLRIRRSPAREAAVQEAARAAETAAEIEAIGRYRVGSAAQRFRDRLRAMLVARPMARTPHEEWQPDPLMWTLAVALGRLRDDEAATLLVDAVAGNPVPRRGTASIRADDPLVTRFGEAALPPLARVVSTWREAKTQTPGAHFVASALASPAAVSGPIDDTRAEVLAALGPVLEPADPSNVYRSMDGDFFYASLTGLAARRPDVVGRALATLADRPVLLGRALQAFDPPSYSSYPYALDVDVVERVFAAARMALGTQAPPDALAALAGEAVRLHVPLPRATLPHAFLPQSAAEAKREILRVWPRHLPSETAVAAFRRVLASGLAEKDAEVAAHAAGLALDIGLYAEAERLADRAVALAPPGNNRDALLVRNRARGAQGDRQAEMAAMQTLSAARGTDTETVARRRLAELEQEKPSRLRVRRREDRYAARGVPLGDGSVLLAGRDQTVQIRDLARGGLTPVAVAPWPAPGVARVDSGRVVAVSAEGDVALLEQGSRRPVWQAKVGDWCEPKYKHPCGAIAADGRVIVLRDASHVAYALAAADGRVLWTRPAGQDPPLVLNGADPIVLSAPASGSPIVTGISGVDPRTGKVRWTRAVPQMSGTWRLAAHRLAWIERGSTLHVVDVRDGRETQVELAAAAASWPPSAIAIAPSGAVVYAVVADTLYAVTRGEISWRREARPPTGGSYKSFHLEAGAETLWLVGQDKEGRSLTVLAPDGAPVATRSWSTAHPSAVPMLIDSETLEVPVINGSELLDLLPEAR